ncbi:MAG: DUF4198 domain-containing protein [Candidatus Tectomicrobia bacterium]|uniref:DUF4198 domain-containing protein n=1 Tax=Tectimicrobiota bacterium TaxID=2528274 RepID=A0A932CRF9_UNCTE|nr:DUF4198 domain-containing protein [Candidatus Tectomicrobia bacterium]
MCRMIRIPVLIVAAFLLGVPSLEAHDFFIKRQGKELMVVYGHGDHREAFDPSKIKAIQAFDLQGKTMDVSQEKSKEGLHLKIAGQPACILVEIDDGYWSKTIYGWKNLPKRKARRVVESIRALYYAKAIFAWSEGALGPEAHARLDLLPLKNPFALKAGDLLPLKVLYQGRPRAGITVEGKGHERIGTTDPEGVVKVTLSKGHQVITVQHSEPIQGDPDADSLRTISTLAFEVVP